MRARYYDANLGRFISRDPIGQVDDVNLYGYVGNNGVMFVDQNWLNSKSIYLNVINDVETWNTIIWFMGLWVTWAWFIPWFQPLIPVWITIMWTTWVVDIWLWISKTSVSWNPEPAIKSLIIWWTSLFGWRYIAKGFTWINVKVNNTFRLINTETWRYIKNTIAKVSIMIEQGGAITISRVFENLFTNN